jgi:hypothetical protein
MSDASRTDTFVAVKQQHAGHVQPGSAPEEGLPSAPLGAAPEGAPRNVLSGGEQPAGDTDEVLLAGLVDAVDSGQAEGFEYNTAYAKSFLQIVADHASVMELCLRKAPSAAHIVVLEDHLPFSLT